jgi:hypothetical protein
MKVILNFLSNFLMGVGVLGLISIFLLYFVSLFFDIDLLYAF